MKRPHVALFTEMGNGHVYPLLPLCSALLARGYRVTCATNKHYAKHVQNVGAEAVVFEETQVDDSLRTENQLRFRVAANDLARFEFSDHEWSYMIRSNDEFLSQTSKFYERNRPDLVMYNRYFIPARIVSHRLDLPAVQLSPHFAYHGRSRFWDRGVACNPQQLVVYGEKLDSMLASHGVMTRDNLWHTEQLNVHFVPRQFQYHHELFDETFVFSGSLLERPIQSGWRPAQRSLPLVLISGYSGITATKVSNSRYFRTFIDALAGLSCHCVLSTGDGTDPQDLGSLPANFEISQRASHLEILPHATLFACHGGMGSSLEALYNGVPVLGAPSSPYTEEVAYRVAELGVGRLLPQSEFDSKSVRQVVSEMLEDTAAQVRAKDLQHVFRSSGGAPAIVERVHQYLNKMI